MRRTDILGKGHSENEAVELKRVTNSDIYMSRESSSQQGYSQNYKKFTSVTSDFYERKHN